MALLGARLAGVPVAVSRATSIQDRDALAAASSVLVLPITGGLTVWDLTPEGVVPVVLSPNFLGLEDLLPRAPGWVGVRCSSWIDGHPTLVDDIAPERVGLRQIRRLATRLSSIGGVAPYHRKVTARWFTMLAADPAVLERGHGHVVAVRLGEAFADVPGGVRIEVAPDATDAHLEGYAASVEAAAAERNVT